MHWLVISNEEDTDGRARVTADEERVLHCSVGWWSFSSGFSLYFSLASFLVAFVFLGVARAILLWRAA